MINTTSQMLYRLDNLNTEQTRISYQMSTGKEIDNGSDNTRVYTQELYINDKIRTYEGLQYQVQKTNAQNTVADDTMTEIKKILDFVKSETLKGRNDTNDIQSRKAIAVQIEGAKASLYTLVNERVEDEYLFSGSKTNVQSFVQDETTKKVTYNGNAHLRSVAVEFNSYRERGITGFDMMMFDANSASTGSALTFYEGEKIIDGDGFEWKLNGAEDTLTQYDEDGDATTNTLAVTTSGTTPNKQYDIADVGGTSRTLTAKHNVFDTIDNIITAFNANDTDAISTGIDEIDKAYDSANAAHGQLGGRNKTFEISFDRITSKLTHYNILSTEVSAADLTKVAVEAKQLELTYTSLYSTINRMNNLSLVNFIN